MHNDTSVDLAVLVWSQEDAADLAGRYRGLECVCSFDDVADSQLSRGLFDLVVILMVRGDEPAELRAAERLRIKLRRQRPREIRVLRVPGWAPGQSLAAFLDSKPSLQSPRALEALLLSLPAEPPPIYHPTDVGNAARFAFDHGDDARYCHAWRCWLVWDGRRWARDETGRARELAKATVLKLYQEAADVSDDRLRTDLAKHAAASQKRDRIVAMLDLAASIPGIPISHIQLDSDPWLMNCENGTLDLRSGRLRPHDRADLITKLCPWPHLPDLPCPIWDATLERVFRREDPADARDLIGFWQRLCGLALAGVVREHLLPIAYGCGSNGKTTVLGALLGVLGPDYAMKAPPSLLMARNHEAHPTERADLFGKRFAVALETDAGGRLNESLVKELTGGDAIRARRMREDHWEFQPTHTLMLATNHKPVIYGTDSGIWRRLKLIPFTVTIDDAEADRALPEKLRAEYPAILAWCVRGCLQWQEIGLAEPPEVTAATLEYRSDQDALGAFLTECTIRFPGGEIRSRELYQRYTRWAEATGVRRPLSETAFGRQMGERSDVHRERKPCGKVYLGLMLRPEETETESDLNGHQEANGHHRRRGVIAYG